MCTSEVMYGAYYPYLQYATSRAGPTTRPFGMTYQYDRVGISFYKTNVNYFWTTPKNLQYFAKLLNSRDLIYFIIIFK